MAGLGAARQLISEGFKDFLIIEAGVKAGGRVETLKVGQSVIDLGAQWVHGIDTDLYNLAEKHDLIHPETSDEALGIYIREDGYKFDDFLVNRVDIEVGKILTACENFVDADEYPHSVGDFLEEKFQKFVDESEEDANLLWQLYDWHVRFQLIDNSCGDLKRLSAKEWGKYSCLGKDGQAHVNLKGGYGALIEALLGDIPKDKILMDTAVERIDETFNGMELCCSKGVKISAKHVIITSSLGVLQRENEMLNFQLPKEISDGIDALGFGGMGKVFLLFDENWWKCDGFQLIWKTQFCEDDLWIRHLSGFDNVLDQPNMLVGWVSDLGVKEMEKTCHIKIGQQCVDLLRKFLNRQEIPYPKKVYKSNWSTNRWIRGAYSHTTPDSDRLGVGPSSLNIPVQINSIPRVLFAGEAAHESHFSTTHGAYESGQKQAKHLLKFL